MSDKILPSNQRRDLDSIIREAEAIEAKFKGQEMPEAEAKKYTELMAEGASLSEKINQEAANRKSMERMRAAAALGHEVPSPTLPAGETKQNDVAGYITPGDAVVLSEEYIKCIKRDGTWNSNAQFMVELNGSLFNKGAVGRIALTEPEVKRFAEIYETVRSHKAFETKDMPVFGSLVVAPMRSDRFVQDTRPEQLTLRDILTVIPTTSNLIQYVAEDSYTNAAAVQSEGTTVATVGTKEEDDVTYELRDEPVRTIATTMPVSEQQLADAPALIARINTRLLHSVRREEERLLGYGSGTGTEFAGFFDTDSGVAAASTSGSTLIDKIREAATEVFVSGYQPSFVWIHPDDWETIELTKDSNGQYIWAVVRDLLGPRIWSMRVVQGVGAKKYGASDRNVLIGDPLGAAIYDRQQVNIAVGWVDDQFAKNLRTIRAEERMTLIVDAPAAFRKINLA